LTPLLVGFQIKVRFEPAKANRNPADLKTAMPPRRFPPPWTFEDHNDACFIVMDASGLAVTYVYYEEEPGRRAAANLMTKEEARRIAANIVKSWRGAR
jgi:endo-1,4-beta-D-glucanase Y